MSDPRRRSIILRGARQHNLRDVDVDLPRHRLVVITGPSGSGKSSLAFDTLYAEGQRRYLESLSAYARQFMEQVPKPDVDRVEGLSPALAIEQKGLGHNPRSTVGTLTEILPFLRVLFARLGQAHCPDCDIAVAAGHPSRIAEELRDMPEKARLLVLAPVLEARRGEQRALLASLRKKGYIRARIDGEVVELEGIETLEKGARHDVDVVVDRIIAGKVAPERLQRSIETALKEGKGRLRILQLGADGKERTFSDRIACPSCGRGFAVLEPRLFSFNSPAGACKGCKGLGRTKRPSPARMMPEPDLSIEDGGIAPLRGRGQSFLWQQVEFLAKKLKFSLKDPVSKLPPRALDALLDGTQGKKWEELREGLSGAELFLADFEGIVPHVERRMASTKSAKVRTWCEAFLEEESCPVCEGSRLSPVARAVRLKGASIHELSALPLKDLGERLATWKFEGSASRIGEPLLSELVARCGFLVEAGVEYLSLDRPTGSLSGGEGQRVRLATQVGSRLTGVLYVLDEPSIGLHARDTGKLIGLLQKLRDRGNSVIVVEHDRDIMEAADHLVDMGPGAGIHGGRVVGEGSAADLAAAGSPTGRWLADLESAPRRRDRPVAQNWLRIRGLRERNLKNIDLDLPLGRLVAITGVSGSGKSTAVHNILYRALARQLHRASALPGEHDSLEWDGPLSKVVLVDQSSIGRSPRSTPATFTGLFAHLRKLLSQTPAARARGFGPGRFSFNTKGGRCEACGGAGVRKLSMDFLPEVTVRCDECHGRRFDRRTLEISWKGHSIADLLDLEVERAHELLTNIPPAARILSTLEAVGLGYLTLGQRADTLSGGEAQRMKLAKELSRPSQGETLYLLDEPTTGLHFQDVAQLLDVLQRLVDRGNTVVVIEHQSDVIQAADHIIDLGPEGGAAGGEVVVAGPVEALLECSASHTGSMLRRQAKS